MEWRQTEKKGLAKRNVELADAMAQVYCREEPVSRPRILQRGEGPRKGMPKGLKREFL